ncbi:hypothetical protein HAX54_049019, partial [Datura stramonium]|nr:hypothetical protein [Datura stramonium]
MEELKARHTGVMSPMVGMKDIRKVMDYHVQHRGLIVRRVMEELKARHTGVMSPMVGMKDIRKVMDYHVQHRGLIVR